jgi:hypothetical protein
VIPAATVAVLSASVLGLDASTASIIVALVAANGTVIAAIIAALLPSILKNRRDLKEVRIENHTEHEKVTTSVDVLATQVAALMALVVESTSELKAHTKWEESQKYASPEHIERLISALKEQP